MATVEPIASVSILGEPALAFGGGLRIVGPCATDPVSLTVEHDPGQGSPSVDDPTRDDEQRDEGGGHGRADRRRACSAATTAVPAATRAREQPRSAGPATRTRRQRWQRPPRLRGAHGARSRRSPPAAGRRAGVGDRPVARPPHRHRRPRPHPTPPAGSWSATSGTRGVLACRSCSGGYLLEEVPRPKLALDDRRDGGVQAAPPPDGGPRRAEGGGRRPVASAGDGA